VAAAEPPAGGGLGRVVAEGFAFGIGSSIARMAIGSIFGDSAADAVLGGEDDVGGDGTNEWGDEDQWDENKPL
jgi:hypothetical protein